MLTWASCVCLSSIREDFCGLDLEKRTRCSEGLHLKCGGRARCPSQRLHQLARYLHEHVVSKITSNSTKTLSLITIEGMHLFHVCWLLIYFCIFFDLLIHVLWFSSSVSLHFYFNNYSMLWTFVPLSEKTHIVLVSSSCLRSLLYAGVWGFMQSIQ